MEIVKRECYKSNGCEMEGDVLCMLLLRRGVARGRLAERRRKRYVRQEWHAENNHLIESQAKQICHKSQRSNLTSFFR